MGHRTYSPKPGRYQSLYEQYLAETIQVGDKLTLDSFGEVRVLAIAEKWVMLRRKGAMPFLKHLTEIASDRALIAQKVKPQNETPVQ